jgi:hypothetical protein
MVSKDDAIWLLRELERLAGKLGVEVRYERLGGSDDDLSPKSGSCRLKGQAIIIVDAQLGYEGRCRVLVEELGRFDLSRVFVTPRVRALMAK